jgi:peptidylprolyl isomerase
MKKIAFLYFFAAALASCAVFHKKGCKPSLVKDPVTVKTASGLQYKITTRGCGEQVQKGDTVKVHYTGKLTNDSVFDSSVKRNEPFSLKIGKGMVIKGWDEGIPLLHVGDKATLTIPPNLGYGNHALEGIPANSTLVFDIEVLGTKAGVRKWNTKGKDTVTTASGLKFISLSDSKQPNSGASPEAGNKVKVHYSGFLLDGTLFDSSVERGAPIEFTLGRGQVIKGWDEGIALLHKGQKGQLIIPYKLAYGENGRPPIIPAKAVLIFDVELVDFSK